MSGMAHSFKVTEGVNERGEKVYNVHGEAYFSIKHDPIEYAKAQAKMIVAAKIADAMEAKGMTKERMAQKMGKTTLQIKKWLSGGHNFTLDELAKIECVLSVVIIDKNV